MKALEGLDRYIKEHASQLVAIRRPAVLPTDLERLSDVCGDVPDNLSALLNWRDGDIPSPTILGEGWRLLPCSDITDRLSILAGSPAGLSSDDSRIDLPDVWPHEWLPIIEWNGSIFGVLDARSAGEQPILGIDPQSGDVVHWAASLPNFLDSVLAQLRDNGRVSIDELMRSRV